MSDLTRRTSGTGWRAPRAVTRSLPAAGAVVALLLAGLAFGGPAGAQTATGSPTQLREGLRFFDTGPLRIREQFLLGQGFLAFEPTSADVLDRGRWQIDLVQNATNTWVQSDAVVDFLDTRSSRSQLTLDELRALDPGDGRGLYYVDGELHRSSLSFRRGIGHGTQLELTVPLLDFGGGIGDSPIEGFHDTFGFSQSGRQGVPRGGFTVYLRDRQGREVYRRRAPSPGLGDVSVGLKTKLPAPAGWQLAAEGQVKLPTGDEQDLYGSGSADVGVEVLATRYFARSCVHGGLSVTRLGEAKVLGTGSQTVLAAMLGYEHAWGASTSAIIQATASQSPFRDLDIQKLDDVAYLVDLGLKHALGDRWVGFAALSENVLNFGSSADVGLHLGVTWTR